MLNLRKSSKDKDTSVGWFKSPDGRCKKHTKHKQSPGVCSLCLREKLTRISLPTSLTSSSNSYSPASSTSCASSLSCSSYTSSCASPLHHLSFTSESSKRSCNNSSSSVSSVFFLNGKHGTIKSSSSSMAVGGRKGGFWSRLLNSTSP